MFRAIVGHPKFHGWSFKHTGRNIPIM